jgi:hypothetical protein
MRPNPTPQDRDRGLRLISRTNRWLIAGAVGLSGLFSVLAAESFHGHTASASTVSHTSSLSSSSGSSSATSSSASSSTSSSSGLQSPSQSPSTSYGTSSQGSTAVSGGS